MVEYFGLGKYKNYLFPNECSNIHLLFRKTHLKGDSNYSHRIDQYASQKTTLEFPHEATEVVGANNKSKFYFHKRSIERNA